MNGFFHSLSIVKSTFASSVPKCGACGLYRGCESPKMPVTGEGKLGILIVAEAPGFEEDQQNIQLIGPAGQLLRDSLSKIGYDLDEDCWKTNAIICRPPGNETPTTDQIDYCRPNLSNMIKRLNPTVIIPMGAVAVRSLIAPLWREDVGPISKWVGWKIPSQRYNAWIAPMYHPSYVRRMSNAKEGPAVKIWFERHLKEAMELENRPWDEIPNYEREVRVVENPNQAASLLRSMLDRGGTIAFDYETNRLKPDTSDAEIVCCSVCWHGSETVSYPWVGNAIEATGELLRSNMQKIGANNKFEDRWTRKQFGFPVKNWKWDCMLSAHHLDNRSGITSVKFQSFVRQGQEPWDDHIRPYLTSTDSRGINRIRELDLRSLLVYCGMDSLMEYLIAKAQKEELQGGCI